MRRRWLILAAMVAAGCGGSGGEPQSAPKPDHAPGPALRGEVVLAAGDIAYCGPTPDEETARLLERERGTVLTLGDNAYRFGRPEEYQRCYEPSWGRFKDRTRPTPGNHDYAASDSADGYFGYFGEAAHPPSGYYSFDLGKWHLVALNSELCHMEGCGPGSEQVRWLERDLADNPTRCTLAYWHTPRFSSGAEHGSDDVVAPFWQVLYESGADVVLNGHEHNYERFAPQDPNGQPDPGRGIRQFVVGTGGAPLYGFSDVEPTSEVRDADTYGVLKLTLGRGEYGWRFLRAEDGDFRDSGSGSCH